MATMATVSQWRQRHAISLSNGLRDLFTQKKLCDVTIQCRERTARAHKVILAACSTVLSGRLLGLDNGAEDTINLDDVIESADAEQSVACVMSLLEFVYTGALCVNDANRQQLLLLADALGMDSAVTYINQGLNSPVEESETKTVCLQTGESSLQTDVSLELSESVDVQSGSGVSRHDDPPGPREGDRRRARRPPLTLAIDVSSQTEPEAVDVNCDVIRPERMTVSTQTDSSSLKGQEAAGEIGIEVAVQTASTPLVLDSIRKDLNNHDYPDQNLGLLEIKQEIFATTEVNVLTRLKRRLRPSYKEVSDLEDTDRDDNDLWPEMENVAVPGDDGEKSTTQASRKISTSKAPAIKRKRGRPRKTAEVASDVAVPIKRKRGRPRKNPLPVKHPRLDEAAGDSNKEEGGQDADESAVDHSAQNESAPAVTTEPGDKRSPIERRSARAKAAGRPGRYSSQWKRNADGEYVCLVCGVAKRTSTSVVSHIMGHTGDRPYHCTHCPKRFKTKAKMTDHVRVHTDSSPVPEPHLELDNDLDKSTAREERISQDTARASVKDQSRCVEGAAPVVSVNGVGIGLVVTGDSCLPTSTANGLNLVKEVGDPPVKRARMYSPTPSSSVAPDRKIKRTLECGTCGRRYQKQHHLDAHVQRHEGGELAERVVCPICGFLYASRATLHQHIKCHAPCRQSVTCGSCNKDFSSKKTLKGHMKDFHTGDNQRSCAVCQRHFRYRSSLLYHRRHSECGGEEARETRVAERKVRDFIKKNNEALRQERGASRRGARKPAARGKHVTATGPTDNIMPTATIPVTMVTTIPPVISTDGAVSQAAVVSSVSDSPDLRVTLGDPMTSSNGSGWHQAARADGEGHSDRGGTLRTSTSGQGSGGDIGLRKLFPSTRKGPKIYHCNSCSFSTLTHSNLIRHNESLHKDRRFKCEECDKVFFSQSGYQRHVDKHKEKYPFRCDRCGKPYMDRACHTAHVAKCNVTSQPVATSISAQCDVNPVGGPDSSGRVSRGWQPTLSMGADNKSNIIQNGMNSDVTLVTLLTPTDQSCATAGPVSGVSVHRDVHTGSLHSGVVRTDSVHTCSVHSGSLHSGSVHTGSVHSGSVHSDAVHTCSVDTDLVHTSSVHSGSVNTGSVHADYVHTGSVHTSSVYTGSVHTDSWQDNARMDDVSARGSAVGTDVTTGQLTRDNDVTGIVLTSAASFFASSPSLGESTQAGHQAPGAGGSYPHPLLNPLSGTKRDIIADMADSHSSHFTHFAVNVPAPHLTTAASRFEADDAPADRLLLVSTPNAGSSLDVTLQQPSMAPTGYLTHEQLAGMLHVPAGHMTSPLPLGGSHVTSASTHEAAPSTLFVLTPLQPVPYPCQADPHAYAEHQHETL